MRFHAPPGAPLQAAVDRLHGHGLFLPTLTGDMVTGWSAPLGASCTTAGTAHTKGAWTEVKAATTAPIQGFWVSLGADNAANGTDTSTLLDIGVGGAGSEVVVVPNMGVGWMRGGFNNGAPFPWLVPVAVPQGSRVAVRAQSIRTSQAIVVWLTPIANKVTHLPTPTALVDVCANTATSYGVALSVPGATNTKGAWTELTAAAPQALQAVAMFIQGAADTIQPNATVLVDVGVGASGAEVVTVANYPLRTNGSMESFSSNIPTLFPVNIPKGARVAARYQTTDTGASIDVQLIGVPA